eukprot:m.19901 g.19901  ORF g.19901 m.19901 type:complete len:206 (+) comp3788_c0_seq1:1005-1622(+)
MKERKMELRFLCVPGMLPLAIDDACLPRSITHAEATKPSDIELILDEVAHSEFTADVIDQVVQEQFRLAWYETIACAAVLEPEPPVDQLQLALEQGVSPSLRMPPPFYSLLTVCVDKNSLEAAELLVRAGADVDPDLDTDGAVGHNLYDKAKSDRMRALLPLHDVHVSNQNLGSCYRDPAEVAEHSKRAKALGLPWALSGPFAAK